MKPFASILVDIDASAAAHPALDRAVRLARNCGAKLTVADVIDIPAAAHAALQPELEAELLNLRRWQLEEIARGITGVTAETKLLTGRPGTALIKEVLLAGHDLLVRSHARHGAGGGPKPYGAVDMELLRQCPCPVMLAGPSAPAAHPQVLGAVNASTEDPAADALNVKIVEITLLMAHLEQRSPALIQAWTPFAELFVRSHTVDEVFMGYVENMRRQSAADLARLAERFGNRLSRNQVHLRRGEPEDAIFEFVAERGIDLVVIGTMARAGIAGLLIGNTAERVLRKLSCSVLAVKPDEFVSPVRAGGQA